MPNQLSVQGIQMNQVFRIDCGLIKAPFLFWLIRQAIFPYQRLQIDLRKK